jgi:hypothetical protein
MEGMMQIDIVKWLIIVVGYLVTMGTSGVVVRYLIGAAKQEASTQKPEPATSKERYDVGAIIGKCENFLTLSLVVADALTALALIFTAKSIVRAEDMRRAPRYYLGGTLVKFSYSVFMGFFVRIVLTATGHPL